MNFLLSYAVREGNGSGSVSFVKRAARTENQAAPHFYLLCLPFQHINKSHVQSFLRKNPQKASIGKPVTQWTLKKLPVVIVESTTAV